MMKRAMLAPSLSRRGEAQAKVCRRASGLARLLLELNDYNAALEAN